MGRGSSKGSGKYSKEQTAVAVERSKAAKAMQNAERNYKRQETMYNHASIVRPNDPSTAKIKARYDKALAKYEDARKRFNKLDEKLTKMEMARIKAKGRSDEDDDIPF